MNEAETQQALNYTLYRGRCKEMSEKACREFPNLTLVRGYYHCPMWGKQEHWWTKFPDGTIHDPTVKQFPTAGHAAEYEEFDGTCECAECSKKVAEADAKFEGSYAYCSTLCIMKHVGL